MTKDRDADRVEQVRALMAAARVERARTLRKLLHDLLRPRADTPAWHPPAKPAVSNCG